MRIWLDVIWNEDVECNDPEFIFTIIARNHFSSLRVKLCGKFLFWIVLAALPMVMQYSDRSTFQVLLPSWPSLNDVKISFYKLPEKLMPMLKCLLIIKVIQRKFNGLNNWPSLFEQLWQLVLFIWTTQFLPTDISTNMHEILDF